MISSLGSNAQVASASVKQDYTLCFHVAREVNVSYYNIEGSEDSINFDVIATVYSKGNSVLPANYSVPLTIQSHRFIRVRQVKMDREIYYSSVIQPGKTGQSGETASVNNPGIKIR